MTAPAVFENFMVRTIDKWLDKDGGVRYGPYISGSYLFLEPLKAEFRTGP